jgi:ABC-type Fe3+-hydroxamate transport system substrate-binding protein
LTKLGKVFGMEDTAAQLIADFEAEIATTKAALRSPGRVSIILPLTDGSRVYAGTNLVGQIIAKLGGVITLKITRLNPDPSGDLAVVSFERVSEIDGDRIVILANLCADWVQFKNNLLAIPVFQSLLAVRNGRVVEVESQAVFGTAGPRGQRQILDALAKALA